jgi:hypothetical protein
MSNVPSMEFADAAWLHPTAAVKAALGVPAIAVGRINSPWLLTGIFAEEKVALIAESGLATESAAAVESRDEGKIATVRQALADRAQVDLRVLIVCGGAQGCETADFLIELDLRLVIVEQKPQLAQEMENMRRRVFL